MNTVLVVGGGISGLTAAWTLIRAAAQHAFPLRCVVLEASSRLGGKIVTERHGNCLIEGGPDSFVARKPWAAQLCHDLGLGDQLLSADDRGRNYVLHRGRPVRVPGDPAGFALTPLLSLAGKLRAARELTQPPRSNDDDESLGDFVARRFGDEVLERLVAPAVGSIYLSDVSKLSTQTSFERFHQLEKAHGSVLRGMLALQQQARKSGAPRPPSFYTLRNGLGSLIETLAAQIEAQGGEVRLNAPVGLLHADGVTLATGERWFADRVVLALPAPAMAELLAPHDAVAAQALRDVRCVDVATVTLAYPHAAFVAPFDGFGVVAPEGEATTVLACEVMTSKWPARAPQDLALIRAFIGGHRNERSVNEPDEALAQLAHADAARMFGLRGEPEWSRVFRWQPGNPQYPVGHLDALAKAEASLSQSLPDVTLTGAALRGLGIPDCTKQAQEAAGRLMQHLTHDVTASRVAQPA